MYTYKTYYILNIFWRLFLCLFRLCFYNVHTAVGNVPLVCSPLFLLYFWRTAIHIKNSVQSKHNQSTTSIQTLCELHILQNGIFFDCLLALQTIFYRICINAIVENEKNIFELFKHLNESKSCVYKHFVNRKSQLLNTLALFSVFFLLCVRIRRVKNIKQRKAVNIFHFLIQIVFCFYCFSLSLSLCFSSINELLVTLCFT